jgi:two-component system, NarL family, response regulator NreC
MPLMRKVRLFVADKNLATRDRIRVLAKSRPDIEVVGEASSGREALAKASVLNPDVVLVNPVSIPETAWLDFVEILAKRSPAMRAVLAGLRDEAEYLASLLGSAVSVMKQPLGEDRLTIGLLLDRGVASPTRGTGSPPTSGSLLSPREHEVLLLLAEGYTSQEIAEKIFRSVKTVETYRASIRRKLGLRNRAEIVHYVRTHGLPTRSV